MEKQLTQPPPRQLDNLEWVGGHPALDFINTVHAWLGEQPGEEYLHGFPELLRWSRMAGLIGPNGTRALDAGGAAAQAKAHRAALALRADLHRLFHAVAGGRPLDQAALDRVTAVLRDTVAWRRITAEGGNICCGWDFTGAPPAAILGPVVWQAVELLERGPLDRIKECPYDGGCGWLFIDTSKNRSRTWCSMKTCGTLAKVRRFRARQA